MTNENDHSFFLVSSARVILDNSISVQSRLLFSILSGLTKKEGYCYASNQYLADLLNSTERAVQKWLVELKEKEYIEVHLWKEGMHQKRAININPGLSPHKQKNPAGNLSDSKSFYGTNPRSSPARIQVQAWHEPVFTHNINSNKQVIEKNNLSCTNSVHKSQPIDNQHLPKKHISTAPPEIKEAAANAALASDDAHKKKNFSFEKIDEELCEEMVFQIKEQCPTFKDPTQSKKTWESWFTSMNRLRRIDKRDAASIRQMMKFIYNDDFWCKNILSPQKLRKQYDNIWMRAFGPQKNIMQNKKTAYEAINTLKTIDKDTLIINHSNCHDAATGTIFSLSENPSEFRKKIMRHFHLREDDENRINYERTQQPSHRL